MEDKLPTCPKCGSEYTYEHEEMYICPDCAHEWPTSSASDDAPEEQVVKDAYGNVLKDGDSVTVIKDLKVGGTSSVLKVGVKVKNIRLVDEVNGHNIDAKVKGIGPLMLKSAFVKKCT